MSLPNPNLPVTEERLQEFYHRIKPYMGGGGSGSDIQVEALPTASEDLEGTILQYIGVTTLTYTHGYFYECVSDGESTPTYSWQATDVQEDSAGHVIEDSEGTALTQRDTLQFGEGFLVEDDSENEKTVITPNVMQSGDMDDVVTPLPSVQSRYHRYSTEEQIVGTWIDGSNVYEKTITGYNLPSNIVDGTYTGTNIPYPSGIARLVKLDGIIKSPSGVNSCSINGGVAASGNGYPIIAFVGSSNISVQANKASLGGFEIVLYIQYTKTA